MREVNFPGVRLLNGDCMEFMRDAPSRWSLAIVDPPYGINFALMASKKADKPGRKPCAYSGLAKLNRTELSGSDVEWDAATPTKEYFDELFRVAENQIIWGGNYFPLPPTRGIICWDKCQAMENFSAWEMAWTSFSSPARLIRIVNNGGQLNAGDPKIHPTQKPVSLYSWLLGKYAQPGQTIIDTHLGSGSSAIAAYRAGYQFTGIEISKHYFDEACSRVERELSQGVLFPPVVEESTAKLL